MDLDLAETIRRAAAARGVDVPEASGVTWCGGIDGNGGCTVEVATRGDFCPACSAANSRSLRANLLRPARATLPDWAHARFSHPDFARCVDPKLARDAHAWNAAKHSTLALLGDTGMGKTTSAVAICNRILDIAEERALPAERFMFARRLRMVRARDISGSSKRARLGGGDSPEVVEATRASLLLLDELGFEQRDDAIDRILDYRYSTPGKVTIVTSGLSMPQLASRYGEATRRRFTELGPVLEAWKAKAVAS